MELYSPFTRTGAPIMVMDCASAEMCKYAANAMLATRISFMNEMAHVCELFGADVDQVRRAVGSDRRIGPSFLFPGVGYGGSCFPKDVKAMVRFSADKGYDFQILERGRGGERRRRSCSWSTRWSSTSGRSTGRRSRSGGWPSSRRPTTCARRRRSRSSRRCWRRARRVQAYDPGGDEGRAGDLRHADRLRAQELRRAGRRRRAGARHRVERVPRAGLREDAQADAVAGRLRRPEHLQPGADEGRMGSPTTRSGGRPWTGPRHRRRRLHRQPRGEGAGRAPAVASSSTTTCRPGTARRRARRRPRRRRHRRRRRACGRRSGEPRRDRRHALRGVRCRSAIRCATRPATTATTSPGRSSVLEAMAARIGDGGSSSRRRARCSASRRRRRSPRRIRRARSTPTARRSWPSSGRCRTSSGRTASGRWRLRYFNAAGADPDGELGEDHAPELHLIPLAHRGGARRAAAAGVRRRLPDARRHLPARLHPRDATWRTRTCWRSTPSKRGGASRTYNLGNGRPFSVREVIAAVDRVTGRPVPHTVGAAAAGRPGGAVRVERPDPGRTRLAAALRRPRRHRRDRVALARRASRRLRQTS